MDHGFDVRVNHARAQLQGVAEEGQALRAGQGGNLAQGAGCRGVCGVHACSMRAPFSAVLNICDMAYNAAHVANQ
jgi:hypothetical protein